MNSKNAQKKNGTMKGGSINHMTSIEKKNEYIKFNQSLNLLFEKCDEEIKLYMEDYKRNECGTDDYNPEEYKKGLDWYWMKKNIIESPVYENMKMICGRKTQKKIIKITPKDFEPIEKNGKTYKSKYVMCRCNTPILRVNWKRHVITPSHVKRLENIAIGKKCKKVDNDILDREETRNLIKSSLYNKENIIIEVHNDEYDESEEEDEENKEEKEKEIKDKKKDKKAIKNKIKELEQKKLKEIKELKELKELEKKEKQELEEIKQKVLSTIKIQRFVRKYLTRKRVNKKAFEKKIIIVQSVIRRFITLKRVIKMKKIKKIVKKQKLKIVDNKYNCECGSVVGKKDKAKHFKTKKHLTFIENKK
jgi:hypothetical protein